MRNVCFVILGITFFFNQNSYAAKEVAGEIVSVAGIVFIRPEKATEAMPKSPPRAKPGDNVYVGDVINTSSEGAVKILMRDKSIVDLGASSLFKVDEYLHNNGNNRKAKLDLMFGKVRVAVTKKIEGGGSFQVKTKGATMGVRGTEFSVSENIPASLSKHDDSQEAVQERKEKAEAKAKGETPKPAQTVVTVFQGKVDVAAAPKTDKETGKTEAPKPVVSLTAGMQVSTGGSSSAAAPQPVKLTETQLTVLKTETKLADNTFTKAITIEPIKSNESENGGNRSPSSGSASNGGFNGPALNISLPPIAITNLPPPEVLGAFRPMDVFVNNAPKNNMKHLHVNIVVSNP